MTTTAEFMDPVDLSIDLDDQSTIVFNTDDEPIVPKSDDKKIPAESNKVPQDVKKIPAESNEVPQEQKVPPELVLPEQNNASKPAAKDANKNALGA